MLTPVSSLSKCVKPLESQGIRWLELALLFSRGMEKTYEAPSNEAPHTILGYHQGRLMTYLLCGDFLTPTGPRFNYNKLAIGVGGR